MHQYQITPWLEVDLVLRLAIAALIGGVLGYERERSQKPAGLRTLTLVCVGAALFTIVSAYGFTGFEGLRDPSRIAAGIVVGIGFLGAGTILRGNGAGLVGLTTAASIWVIAGIGMALGTGMYFVAVAATVITVITLRFPIGRG